MYYIYNINYNKGGEIVADYILKKVDDKLWHKVKVLVAMRGTTIRGLIIELLEKEVKKGK